ncbi:DUF4139 domain-containing protein [Dinghuibacter silviterrae]|uniref:Uncharacterized protein (TIGR02231 family) n=1 Tax=Dinghuibacter silviterrae TaxID=1539049 RepID=A0A4R8DGE3_9BACT|nr:DUF4139 domain-containing protein [Dinghuibacter silviterrae]TDW96731.1 uncharacterized protein (TIGR02231 family) [Dinghuibacter silviterrae]
MKNKIGGLVLFCLLCMGANAGNSSEPLNANAVLTSVMVYRSGAEMNHAVSATLPAGTVELAVDRLSTDIDKNSVQIRVPSTVTLLGFTYINDYMAEKPNTARQQLLEDSLDRVTEAQDKVQLSLTNNDALLGVLQKNQELKGVNAVDLQKLMEYYKATSADLEEKQYDLKKRFARLGKEIDRLKAQIQEEASQNTKESGRLVLRLSVRNAGSYDFTLSYITHKASWSPSYEIQVGDAQDSSVKVIYKASINQTTGIDWKQVKMALSTSTPGNWNIAPELNPWFVGFRQTAPVTAYGMTVRRPAPTQLDEVVVAKSKVVIRGDGNDNEDATPMYIVDGQIWSSDAIRKIDPAMIASTDILKGDEATSMYGSKAAAGAIVITLKKDLSDYTDVDQQRLNTVYNIDLPYDLPSTGKDQTANLQVTKVKALFTYLAVPKVSDDVYLLADIPDWGKLNLLPGKANIVLDGTYVGLTDINPSSTQDTLHLTVGKDKRITLQRRKVTDFSSEKFLGANRYQKYVFEISARNNKNQDVQLSVLDQIPLSTNKDIEVTLNDPGSAQVNADKGELRWTLSLKAGESTKVHFGYTLKYPKGTVLDALARQ